MLLHLKKPRILRKSAATRVARQGVPAHVCNYGEKLENADAPSACHLFVKHGQFDVRQHRTIVCVCVSKILQNRKTSKMGFFGPNGNALFVLFGGEIRGNPTKKHYVFKRNFQI